MKRVSSPEQLDKLMTVINPVGWMALLITAIVLGSIIAWGFLGRLPVVTKGPGLLMQPGRVRGVFSLAAGQVVELYVHRGQLVSAGSVVARLQLTQTFPDTSRVDLISTQTGRVSDILVRPGSYVNVGERVINLIGESDQLIGALFFPLDQGKKVHVGMEVRISPSTVKEDDYGFLIGHAVRVSPGSVSEAEMNEVLGNSDLVKLLVGAGGIYASAPIYIQVELERAPTPSGFEWTSHTGPNYTLSAGTVCQASVVTDEERPIDLVLPYVKKLLGAASWQQ